MIHALADELLTSFGIVPQPESDEDWKARVGVVLQSWRDHPRWTPRRLLTLLGSLVWNSALISAGYALGAADTTRFEHRCEELWWPGLRARYEDPVAVPAHRRDPDEQLRHRRLLEPGA